MTREDQIIHRAKGGPLEVLLWREPEGGISLTIDDYWQFASRDEHVFHEVLVDPAMIMAPDPRRVLILGGGDGLAARNVLRYGGGGERGGGERGGGGVEQVVLVDNDPQVTRIAREVAELVELNEGALLDPRVELIHGDARAFIEGFVASGRECFGVVICDFPAPAHARYARLFDADFYTLLAQACEPEAVVSVQVSAEPSGFWPIVDAIAPSFPELQPRLVELSEDDWASFVLASSGELRPRRSLAPGLRFLSSQAHEELVITSRAADRFETRAYGVVEMA